VSNAQGPGTSSRTLKGGKMGDKKDLFTQDFILTCKERLLEAKRDLLNRIREARSLISEISSDKGGDEGDQTLRILAEKNALTNQKRIRETLIEVESALARIEQGCFGVCEETEELIEKDRLLALPWTRLSIEGAEARENLAKTKKSTLA